MAVTMGSESAQKFNARIAAYPRFPGVDWLSKGVIRIKYEQKVHTWNILVLTTGLCCLMCDLIGLCTSRVAG